MRLRNGFLKGLRAPLRHAGAASSPLPTASWPLGSSEALLVAKTPGAPLLAAPVTLHPTGIRTLAAGLTAYQTPLAESEYSPVYQAIMNILILRPPTAPSPSLPQAADRSPR